MTAPYTPLAAALIHAVKLSDLLEAHNKRYPDVEFFELETAALDACEAVDLELGVMLETAGVPVEIIRRLKPVL